MKTKRIIKSIFKTRVKILLFMGFLIISCNQPILQNNKEWQSILLNTKWIAFNPTNCDPENHIDALPESIEEDLDNLKKYGFEGLVTYGSSGVLGKELPKIAHKKGFLLIMGIWDITSNQEINNVITAVNDGFVFALCAGNEGLDVRYSIYALKKTILELKNKINIPITTAEQIDDYFNTKELCTLGDFIFPIIHPYYYGFSEPISAAAWVNFQYSKLKKQTDLPILIKETSFATAGDKFLSEDLQANFYYELSAKEIPFCFFESYNQKWKKHSPIEPHFGLFNEDRTPKKYIKNTFSTVNRIDEKNSSKKKFFVYSDDGAENNHFFPCGFMGDCSDSFIMENCSEKPFKGKTCTKYIYKAQGLGPNMCEYTAPCNWSGVYYLKYQDYWGVGQKRKGYSLSEYKYLKFAARANKETTVKFFTAGIDNPFGDSQKYPISIYPLLTTQWQEYTIDISKADFSNIIGGFGIVTNKNENPSGVTIYIDEIRFEN